MDISSAAAAGKYLTSKPATSPQETSANTSHGANLAKDFAETLQTAERTAQAAMTGGADPHALVQALAQTELAVETAVTVRDKVVQAYQEILRMPV